MAFNDKEIAQIIELITQHSAHLQYIGARYVPIFGRVGEDSIEWDDSKPYEPLTIVLHQGNSFTSRQFVPAGIDITNEDFWANTGNYNAQIEQYRQEVQAFDARITQNTESVAELEKGLSDEATNRVNADNDLSARIDAEISNREESINGLETELNDLGANPTVYDPDKGIVQGNKYAFMLPAYANQVCSASFSKYDALNALYYPAEWYVDSFNELKYNQSTTFHYEYDADSESLVPYLPTEHMTDGKMGIDCATFVQMVANSINYDNSPYKGNTYFWAYAGKLFTYTNPNVVKYWTFQADQGAGTGSYGVGRMLTYQYAKFLADNGMLVTGNFTKVPGMHVFFGDTDDYPDRFMGIYHCAVILNNFVNSENETVYQVIDASSPDTAQGIEIRNVVNPKIVAGYYPKSVYRNLNAYARDGQVSLQEGTPTSASPTSAFMLKLTNQNATTSKVNLVFTDANEQEYLNTSVNVGAYSTRMIFGVKGTVKLYADNAVMFSFKCA